MGKLKLENSLKEILTIMSNGNPGSVQAMIEIVKHYSDIDPDSSFGAIGMLFEFDDMDIYGSDIYILWNDKCNRDVRKLVLMMRAKQLGFISSNFVVKLAKDQMRVFNVSEEQWLDWDSKVCGYLDNFMTEKKWINFQKDMKTVEDIITSQQNRIE